MVTAQTIILHSLIFQTTVFIPVMVSIPPFDCLATVAGNVVGTPSAIVKSPNSISSASKISCSRRNLFSRSSLQLYMVFKKIALLASNL